MKNSINPIKIGFIRRPDLWSATNEDQLSPRKPQQKLHHSNSQDQVLEKQINNTAPGNSIFPDQKSDSTPLALQAIKVNVPNGVHSAHIYNTNVPNSVQSLSSSVPTERASTNIKEISSETKWPMRKKIFVSLLIFTLVCIIVIVPIVLSILLTRQTATTTTTIPTSTVASTVISAAWSFDNTTADSYNVYNGQLINNAAYSPNTVGAPYIGYARALNLISASNQSFLVASPFLDLTYTSFTIEAWIYPIVLFSGDRGIFGQCYCSSCINQCLYVTLRSNRLYAGFTLNDITSSLTLTMTTWYHIAFVYNYQTRQQILYINGVQDTIRSNVQPYQGLNATIQIGAAQVSQTMSFFNGYIDNVNIVTRAKSSAEILNDATLVAYYSFDASSLNYDNGPNGLNGTLVNAVTVSGRVNQAVRFISTSSYFQVNWFHRFGYALLLNSPYSISMWINPTSVVASTIVQMSTIQLSGSCNNIVGLNSPTGLTGQIMVQGVVSWWTATIIGPFISVSSWTHVSLTFSPTNGYSLYVNGIFFGSTGTSTSSTTSQMVWLYIGYAMTCSSTYFTGVGYQGSIDEVYFYTRELTQADITTLANP